MRFRYSLSFRLTLLAVTAVNGQLLTDVNLIQGYWGQVSPYHDNAENHFGVNVTGLPDGCQVEQAHLLQRHADRFPTSGEGQGMSSPFHSRRTSSNILPYIALFPTLDAPLNLSPFPSTLSNMNVV